MTDDKSIPEQNGDVKALKKKIIRQVEFYFGDYNLIRDKFMLEEMKKNDGWFTMDVMLQFKRLASICSEPATILDALSDADTSLLEIDLENKRIRRRQDRAVPTDNQEFRTALHARTVHVKGFMDDESIDDIHDFMLTYGKVDGIQLLRTTDRKFKGSIFVTFSNSEDAEKFINAPMVYYKGLTELTKMSRRDYYKHMEQSKKTEKSEKQDKTAEDKTPLHVLKVSGITDDTITHRDIKGVFESKGVQSIIYFDRFQKGSEDGYLIFRSEETLDAILKECGLEDGGKETVKSATVEFSIPDEEEEKKTLNLYFQTKLKFANRPFNNKQKKQGRQPFRKQQNRKGGKRTVFDDGEEANNEPTAKVSKLD